MSPAKIDLLSEALKHAAEGTKVFPVGLDKKPFAGSHGFKDASDDPEVIERMDWERASGIGAPTGNGFFVLDVDPRNGGDKSLDALVAKYGQLPPSLTVKTGGGGSHYYFLGTGVPTGTDVLGPGLDIKGEGGYVIIPPSAHKSGRRYELVVDTTPALPPQWILDGIFKKHTPKAAPTNGIGKLTEGGRNAGLTRQGGKLRRAGLHGPVLDEALQAFNRHECKPPLETKEVSAIAASVDRYTSSDPVFPTDVLGESDTPKAHYQTIAEVKVLADEIAKQPRISLGIPALDKLLNGGALARQCVAVGAFVANGKSTFCTHQAISHAKAGRPVLLVCAEVCNGEAYQKLAACDPEAVSLPVFMYDASRTAVDVAGEILRFLEAHDGSENTPVIIIDFLQNLRAPSQHSREREVATCVELLQELARKHAFLLILAAQLNRESNRDEKPQLRHFRESGVIEQAADIALLLQKIDDTQLRIEVAKFRWGRAPSEVTLWCDFERSTLKDCDTKQLYKPLAEDVADYLKKRNGKSTVRALCRSIWWRGKRPTKKDIQETEKLFNLWAIEGRNVTLADPVDISELASPPGILSFDPATLERTSEEQKTFEARMEYEKQSGIDFGAGG